jgi:hypothetical protein
MRLTGIEPAPVVRSFGEACSANSFVVSWMFQPCCQPWYS